MKNRFTPLHRALAAAALVTAGSLSAQAQSVGVGTTAPDASAAFDVVSSAKGALLPRLTTAQRTGIASPATGLIVYQTDGTTGFYYNSGTPGAPVWQQIATAAGAAVTADNGLTKTGANVRLGGPLTVPTTIAQGGNAFALTGGNVGIGTAAPATTLDVNGSFSVNANSLATAQISQPTKNTTISGGGTTGGQSFTMPTAGTITAFTLEFTTATTTTVTFYQGVGNAGAQLTAPQTVTFAANTAQTVPLTAPLAVAAGAYTMVLGGLNNACSNANPYAGGSLTLGTTTTAFGGTIDLLFGINYTTSSTSTTLFANTGNVGVGTNLPTANLDVAGTTRLRGLTVPGLVQTDALGNLSSATAASLDPTTASNGLSEVGNDVRLGGPLTQATTVAQGSNFFALTGAGQIGLGTATANNIGAHVTVQAAAVTEPGMQVGLSGASTAIAFKTEHNGSNFIVRPVSAGGTSTAIENTGGGALAINPTIGNVGIGTTAPAEKLDVAGNIQSSANIAVDYGNANAGTVANALRFGPTNSGEAIGGKRTAGGNQFGLDFYTTSTNRMAITSAGNVGIGTTTPTALLDVNGSTRLRGLTVAGLVQTDASGNLSSATAASLDPTTASNGLTKVGNDFRLGGTLTAATTIGLGANSLSFTSTTGTVGIGATSAARLHVRGLGNAFPATTGTTQSAGLISRFQTVDNAILDIGGNGGNGMWLQSTDITALNLNYPLMLNPNGGNVGIGTTAPAEKLDVVGNIQSSANIAVDYNNANAGTVANSLRFGPTNSGEAIGSKRTATGNQFGLDFYTTSTNRMAITTAGNVGIGTTTPTALLDVNGSTRLRGLTVAGLVQTDASGNLSSATAASLDPTTASNGLTEVGNDIRLGGALTGATAVSGITAANTFDLGGSFAPRITNTTAASAAANRVLTLKTNYANAIPGSGGYLSFTDGGDGEFSRIASRDEGGAGGFVGLTFSTNNGGVGGGANFAERLRITGSGRVGIGTTAPQAQLHLYNGTPYTPLFQPGVVANGTAGYGELLFGNGGATKAAAIQVIDDGNFGGGLYFNVHNSTGGDNWPTGAQNAMTLRPNGNVGIGTVSPAAKLTVQTAADADQGLRVTNGTTTGNIVIQPLAGGNTGFSAINYNGYYGATGEARYNTGKNRWRVGVDQRNTTDAFFIDTYNGTAGTTPFAITTNGNVGIGTTAPSATLEVNGYTKLDGPSTPTGASIPAIATALFTGNLPAAAGGNVGVSLGGITTARVLSVSVVALAGNGNYFPPNQATTVGFGTGYEYGYYLETGSNSIRLTTGTNAGNVLGGSVKILVTYMP